jgi:type IV fimbrial biogenesis protein FimT
MTRPSTKPTTRGAGPRPDGGFTLVELMVTVAIAAILLTIGVPAYQTTTSKYRINSEVNGLVGDLQYARSEAIKQGTNVTVCISTDGATCSGSSTSWAAGHIVITNPPTSSGTASGTVGAGSVLRQQPAFSGTDTASAVSTASGHASVASIQFNRDGFAGTPSTSSWSGFSSLAAPVLFTVDDAHNTAGLGECISVNSVGQISVVTDGASDMFGNTCS